MIHTFNILITNVVTPRCIPYKACIQKQINSVVFPFTTVILPFSDVVSSFNDDDFGIDAIAI